MKVTFKPDISTWKSNCECYQCSSKMEINGDDVKYKKTQKWSSGDSWGDGAYYTADCFYVLCAVCNKELEIKSIQMPFLLREAVMARCQGKISK